MKQMKRGVFGICLIGLVFLGCKSTPKSTVSQSPVAQRTIPQLSRDVTPRPNESEMVIEYMSSILNKVEGMVNVYIDGELMAEVFADTSERIIIPNGTYKLMFRQAGKTRITFPKSITVDSQRKVLSVAKIFGTFSVKVKDEIALSTRTAGLNRAITVVGNSIVGKLPNGSRIAVLSISTNSQQEAIYVINELEHTLVNSQQYQIVDRNSLDVVRTELRYQLSGDVSDATAVSIGYQVGANVVITGSINRSSAANTLQIKAIDVRTSDLLAVEREYF